MTRLRDYRVDGAPIAPRPITVEEVLYNLKLSPTLASNDDVIAYVEGMIDAAVIAGEKITKRTFRQSNFIAFWDAMYGGRYAYEVRACPLASITALEYQSGGVENVFDESNILIIFDEDFSRIQPNISTQWPSNTDPVLQSSKLTFVAGYAEGELPEDLKRALLLHTGAMWVDRGDCSGGSASQVMSCNAGCSLPPSVQNIYRQNRIMDLMVGD